MQYVVKYFSVFCISSLGKALRYTFCTEHDQQLEVLYAIKNMLSIVKKIHY